MLVGPLRLSIVTGLAALGAIGVTLALVGFGLPFLLAALLAAAMAGLVQFAAQRYGSPTQAPGALATPASSTESVLRQELEEYRASTATLRHDLRGVLSPALMMSDRLLNHADPGVQRAGNAVVRSIERATTLLADNKDFMQPEAIVAPATVAAPATSTASTPEQR